MKKSKTAIYILVAVLLIAVIWKFYNIYQKKKMPVLVDYASEERSGSGLVHEFTDDCSEFAVDVQFSARWAVTNFKLLALDTETIDDAGEIRFRVARELYSLPELKPEKPLVAKLTFAGDIPNNGISYIDAFGIKQTYAVAMSGKDTSLILIEASIS